METQAWRGGSKRRSFDPRLLEELVDIRIKEQVPWKSLPIRYMELLPEGVEESLPDWRTLRNAVLQDINVLMMPTRVHKKMRTRLEQEFEKADLGAMLMNVLLARYGEWNLLHDKWLLHAAHSGIEDEVDAEHPKPPEFTVADRNRMDALADQVTSTVFQLGDYMRSVHLQDNSLMELVERVTGSSPGGVRGPTEVDNTTAQIQSVTETILERVQEKSIITLESINAKHRAEGRGHYRDIPESEEDLLEVD